MVTVTEELCASRVPSSGTKVKVKEYLIPPFRSVRGSTRSVLNTSVEINGRITKLDKDRASVDKSMVGTSCTVHEATPNDDATIVAGTVTLYEDVMGVSSITIRGAPEGTTVTTTAVSSERKSPSILEETVSVTRTWSSISRPPLPKLTDGYTAEEGIPTEKSSHATTPASPPALDPVRALLVALDLTTSHAQAKDKLSAASGMNCLGQRSES
mmetsp:Transcript_20660/g.34761  ORF Transcript_20660/g.34761 Transcript_20660/m.34761 type:complete len:213 (+) Transcript_20660:585-1223(+)